MAKATRVVPLLWGTYVFWYEGKYHETRARSEGRARTNLANRLSGEKKYLIHDIYHGLILHRFVPD